MTDHVMTDAELEPSLRKRFDVRAEVFQHGPLSLDLIMPRNADDLLDEQAFAIDERLPYWAELWPSARALACRLLDHPPTGRTVELGCGVGLPSLACLARGCDILATDYYEDALLFARANAHRNHLPPLHTALLDWRHLPADLGHFDTLLLADVLYERGNIQLVHQVIGSLLAPGGTALLADPQRAHLPAFIEQMTRSGYAVTLSEPIPQSQPGSTTPSRVVIATIVSSAIA
jgi:predicted nicotinamide N-methyase